MPNIARTLQGRSRRRVVLGSILCDPAQPNPLQVEKFGPNPTQYKLQRSLQFSSDVFLYKELIL